MTMTPERHRQITETFQHIADVPVHARDALLTRLCAGDDELRREVESLLRHHHDQADEFHDANVGVGRKLVEPTPTPQSTLPSHIGRFRIIRRLGEGGMGVVFEAEQDHPRRTVALKVIRAGLASDSVVRRFRHEAEVLGRLQHLGIADVYEAGVAETPLGPQPYFAMQLIHGQPLIEYAKRNQLDTRARLELFTRVCDAVQYAHQRGIIHRDLKPANILIDESGQPKVLDFGVARVADSDMTLATMQTVTGQVIGTLPYMSPEQVAGRALDVDTRSDVYSLGVSLYELLAERLPYKVTNCTLPEAARIISDVEPTHLSVIDRRFRGDIETIVTKALQKDRAQRYASVAELAADIRRYLADEPVQARPPSAMYQLRKFARRNKSLVGGVLGVFAALVLGLAGVLWFAAGESRQRATAENVSSEARRLAYRVSVAAAADAIAEHTIVTARRLLDDAPQELRGWEWHHLSTTLDDSIIRFAADSMLGGWLHPRADGTVLSRDPVRIIHADPFAQRTIATYVADRASSIAVSADANVIARPFEASKITLHDIDAGSATPIPTPDGVAADDSITALAFNADGTLLGVCHASGKLVVHDLRQRSVRWIAPLSMPDMVEVSFSPHDRWVAATGRSGVEAFAVENGAAALKRRRAAFVRFAPGNWSPDASILYRRELTDDGKHGFIMAMRVETGEEVARWPAHTREVGILEFAPDHSTALVVFSDGLMRLVDPTTGNTQLELTERANGASAMLSPDGEQVVFTELSGLIRILDRRSGARIGALRGQESAGVLGFLHDRSRLYSRSNEGVIRVWDYAALHGPNTLRGHTRFVYPVSFSPDGKLLVSGGWDNTIRLWDLQTRRELRLFTGHTSPVIAVVFSPDGRRLLSRSMPPESADRIWDIEAGTSITLPPPNVPTPDIPCFIDETPRVWLPGPLGPSEQVWNAATQEIEPVEWTKIAPLLRPYVSPDGQWVVRRGVDPTSPLRPTLVSTRDHTVTRAIAQSAALAVFNRDGTRLATTAAPLTDTITIWDVATGAKLHTLAGHIGEIFDVRFSPDGSRLATTGRDATIRIWDAKRFEFLVRLRGHTDYVWGLNWSPDCTMLASGSGDNTIRLWPSAR